MRSFRFVPLTVRLLVALIGVLIPRTAISQVVPVGDSQRGVPLEPSTDAFGEPFSGSRLVGGDIRFDDMLSEDRTTEHAAFPVQDIAASSASASSGWPLGRLRITPYGSLWADMIYETERTHPGAFTLFVNSRDVQAEPAFVIDVRRTRLGFDVTAPQLEDFPQTRSAGRVEIDFFGQFVTENQTGVQLRHAYWELRNDSYRVLVGQNWDVISPLNPHTVNYSVGWMGGNIGFRRAQFRLERFLYPARGTRIVLQGSLNQDIVSDFTSTASVRRENAAWPVLEGRVGFEFDHTDGETQPLGLGFSAHIGETGFDFLGPGPPPLFLPPEDDARFRTWSFNVDLHVPVTDRWGIQGEFFTGANLSPFLGGVGQGVCPCLRVPIRSTGGWLEVWYDWTEWLQSHAGFGIDDPNNNDSLLGRTRNQFLFANVMFDITDNLRTGFEVSYWSTTYHELREGLTPDELLSPSAPGRSVVLDWMMQYSF